MDQRLASRRSPAAGRRQRQRGASLVEAMIGFLVVAVGMLATAQWQSRLRQAVDLARQQAEAVRVAQREVESLRAFATRDADATLSSFADIASSAAQQLDAAVGANTAYSVARQVQGHNQAAFKALSVSVSWLDSRGVTRRLSLDSLLAAQAPASAMALARPAVGRHASPLTGRHAAVPLEAVRLSDGRSVYKPLSDGSEAWVFDDRSGHIRARCGGIPAGKANHALSTADLTQCTPVDAVLLSGRVRFAATGSPTGSDAAAASEPPLPLTVSLLTQTTGHAQPPVCVGEAVKLVGTGTADRRRAVAAPAAATPADLGHAGWTDLGDRHWRYHCAITLVPGAASGDPAAPPHWSGRLQFSAGGWTVGTVAGARRICRYSADTDGSGQVDRAAENSDMLSGVDDALAEQNFLVIDGTQPCPIRSPSTLASGTLPWSHANPATVPHQP